MNKVETEEPAPLPAGKGATILILIGEHLCSAPRAMKEAEALASIGHTVTIAGFWLDARKATIDRTLAHNRSFQFEVLADLRLEGGGFKRMRSRVRCRIARELYRRFRMTSPHLLGYAVMEMLWFARRFAADLTIVHAESGLWVGNQLLDGGRNVGVDFEDWFSDDLLPEDRIERPVEMLRALEQRLAKSCVYRLTTSHAMADAMAKAYEAPRPAVVYNTFPPVDRAMDARVMKDRGDRSILSLHWFSQTIGRGRGLETLLKALPMIPYPIQVHLRGDCSESNKYWLEGLIPQKYRDQVWIHETVANDELPHRIAEHDVGCALEIPYCNNKQYTASNKLFQYMEAGLCIIASDTAGQREVMAQCPDAGFLIPPGDAEALAAAVAGLAEDRNRLEAAKQASLRASRELFPWDQSRGEILAAAKSALSARLNR